MTMLVPLYSGVAQCARQSAARATSSIHWCKAVKLVRFADGGRAGSSNELALGSRDRSELSRAFSLRCDEVLRRGRLYMRGFSSLRHEPGAEHKLFPLELACLCCGIIT